jgi:hypothetical protein
MRAYFFKIILLPISLLAACVNNNNKTISFIPGTYVNVARSEYSVANDTLTIRPVLGASWMGSFYRRNKSCGT